MNTNINVRDIRFILTMESERVSVCKNGLRDMLLSQIEKNAIRNVKARAQAQQPVRRIGSHIEKAGRGIVKRHSKIIAVICICAFILVTSTPSFAWIKIAVDSIVTLPGLTSSYPGGKEEIKALEAQVTFRNLVILVLVIVIAYLAHELHKVRKDNHE